MCAVTSIILYYLKFSLPHRVCSVSAKEYVSITFTFSSLADSFIFFEVSEIWVLAIFLSKKTLTTAFFVVFLFFGQLMKLMNYIFYHLQSKVPCCNRAIKSNNRDINNSRWCKFFIPFSLFKKKLIPSNLSWWLIMMVFPLFSLFFFSHFHKTPTAWAVDDRRWSWTAHHQSLSKSFEMPVSLRGAMPFLKAKWPAIPGPNYPGPVKASHFLQVKKKRRTNPSSTSSSLSVI